MQRKLMKRRSRYQSQLVHLFRVLCKVLIGISILFRFLESVLFRALRPVIGVVYLPAAMAMGFLLGHLNGPSVAPLVMEMIVDPFLGGLEIETVERVCRWAAAVGLLGAGYVGYQRHQVLSRLRLQHEFTYARYREIVGTPGSRITDFIWSYLTAVVLVFVPVGVAIGIVFGIPLLITQNLILLFLLFVFFGSGFDSFLRGTAAILIETFRPRRLEAEVQGADKITPVLEKQYQEYLAQKKEEERLKEVQRDDW